MSRVLRPAKGKADSVMTSSSEKDIALSQATHRLKVAILCGPILPRTGSIIKQASVQ